MSEKRKVLGRADIAERYSKLASIDETEATRRVDGVVNSLIDLLLEGNDITIFGHLSFKHSMIKERESVHPSTGEPITYPAVRTMRIQLSERHKHTLRKLGVSDLE